MLSLQKLIDDSKCYKTVREMRWPQGVRCPHCDSGDILKQGFDEKEKARQRYSCNGCTRKFDDLTNTVFAGHHQPLRVWILCLYFMGLNLSNEQIAKELGLNAKDAQNMTTQLREGIVKKSPSPA